MKRPNPRVLTLALAASLLSLYSRSGVAATENTATVFTTKAVATELFEILSYPARVIPRFNTNVLAEADGVVSRIYAPLGERVGRGHKLLSITHLDPVYQYAPVTMTAPVAGVVSAVEVTEGTQVTKGQKLASVTDPSQVRVSVEVPAQDLPLLTKGMPGELRVPGREAPVALKVRGLSPFVDPATGTATCELELAQAKDRVAPGLMGQVTFKAGAHRGISIPDYAVLYRGTDAKETRVRLIENGKARQVAVKLGRKERGNVEILAGLPDGAQVVLRSSRYVADGEAVNVQETKPESVSGTK